MSKGKKKNPIKDRAIWVFGGFIGIFFLMGAVVLAKSFWISVIAGNYWREVSARQQSPSQPLKPMRGNIISSDGKLMASSLPEYKLFIDLGAGTKEKDSTLWADINEIAKGLNKIFPDKSTQYFKQHLLKGRTSKQKRYYPLYPYRVSYLQYKEVRKLPVLSLSPNRGGVIAEPSNNRKKPFGSLAERTLGDLFPDQSLGAKNGLELTYDSLLRGVDGVMHYEQINRRRVEITDRKAVDGYDIVTTINVDVQDIAEKALMDKVKEIGAVSGVAMVMDVKTGEILANVNLLRNSLGNYTEANNIALSSLMEPGSTFKTASIMVALEDGYATPDDVIDTGSGVMNMYGSKMKDWNYYKGGFGSITVTKGIEVSSNIVVSKIIDDHYKQNPQKFIDGLKRMGMGVPLNLGFQGEAKPVIRGPKEQYFAKTTLPWMSIGYGTQVPPVYILNFYNAIANNGTMMKPLFVKSVSKAGEIIEEYPPQVVIEKICSDKTISQIQTILERVVEHGLGKPAHSPHFRASGKTGTAQVSQGTAGYKSGGRQHLVSFCGYFPSESPQYTCLISIVIDRGSPSGGLMAGAVFKNISERLYARRLRGKLEEAKDSAAVFTPQVLKGDLKETALVLQHIGIPSNSQTLLNIKGEVWGKPQWTPVHVTLQKEKQYAHNKVPNVQGMGAKDAVYLLKQAGLRVQISGVGRVTQQSITPGTMVQKGTIIKLTLNSL